MSAISKMMEACGEAEARLASELMQHEVQIETDVLDPLNQLAEVQLKKDEPFYLLLRFTPVSRRSRFRTF